MSSGGLEAIGEHNDKPDGDPLSRYSTKAGAGGGLNRTSVHTSLGNNAVVKPTLTRVSAHNYPNLSRASQLGLAARSAGMNSAGLGRSSVVKAQQEMERRDAAPTTLGFTLSLTNRETRKAAVYKNDGARFKMPYTLKVIEGHPYTVTIVFKEDTQLGNNMVAYLKEGVLTTDIEFEESNKKLVGVWECDTKACKNGERKNVVLNLPIDDFGICELPLSIKSYPLKKRKAAESGMSLKSIFADFRKEGDRIRMKKQQWVSV